MRAGIGGARASTKPPNIVFILADDLGYADVSCYGRPDLSTPNIDRIAAQGLRFLQAYANSAVCTATRTALITGRYQYRLRLGLEEPLVGNPDVGLPPEHPTLPSLLKKAAYSSTLVGKWHLGALPKFGPLTVRVVTIISTDFAAGQWTTSRTPRVATMIFGTMMFRSTKRDT
jgi:arylsulfatase A-like enzyme